MYIKPTLLLSLCALLFFPSCKQRQELIQETTPVSAVSTEEQQFDAFVDSLKKAGATDYHIINEIRKYLAPRIDYGKSRDTLSASYYLVPWEDFSGFHCIRLFEQNKLTGKCGLTSYVLAKLYDRAGYRNYIYDCGYDTFRLSHEFNLVEWNGKLIVQDAFMDMTITDASGTPKDFIAMLGEIRRGDFSNIHIVEESISSEYWEDSLKKEVLAIYCSDESYQSYLSDIAIVDNRIKIMLNRSYPFLAGSMLQNLRANFQREGLPDNFLSVYLKPKHLRDGNSGVPADSLLDAIRAATGSGLQD